MPPHETDTPADPDDTVPCFDCGADTRKNWGEHTFTYGLGPDPAELRVTLPIHVCPSCGFECLDDEAETLKHEAICAHLGVLSPNEIRGIRRMHGMSRAAFSKVTGLGEATLNRWENGILIQSTANDRYLRLLAVPNSLRTLKRLASEPAGSCSPRKQTSALFAPSGYRTSIDGSRRNSASAAPRNRERIRACTSRRSTPSRVG